MATTKEYLQSALAAIAELQKMSDDELAKRRGQLEKLDAVAWEATEEPEDEE